MGSRRTALLVVVALLAGIVGGACGGSGGSDDSVGDGRAAPRTTRAPAPADAAASYVGLTEAAAIARAEAEDRPWRIGREDDEQFLLTQDFVEDRVTFEIDDGVVTKATLG